MLGKIKDEIYQQLFIILRKNEAVGETDRLIMIIT